MREPADGLALVPRLDRNRKEATEAADRAHPGRPAGDRLPRGVLHAALVHYFGAGSAYSGLLHGIGLTRPEAVLVASLIGPGQVAGRILEWTVGRRFDLLTRARIAALLFPLGAALLLLGGPVAAIGFAVLYGMSNGIMTINRGTLPLALFGPDGYATVLGWLAVPVLLAQAMAPTVAAPLVAALPALGCS